MWSALIFDFITLPVVGFLIWDGLRTGRLLFKGTRHVSREETPFQFWFWIGFACFWCLVVLGLTLPDIWSGF